MSQRLMQRAVDYFGSEQKLGIAIGYTQRGVNRARRSGQVTPQMAYAIHAATRGDIHYRALCPLLDCRAQLKAARRRLDGRRR